MGPFSMYSVPSFSTQILIISSSVPHDVLALYTVLIKPLNLLQFERSHGRHNSRSPGTVKPEINLQNGLHLMTL